MSNCLVTGGAGFIGSNLADVLIAEGHKVSIIDSLITGKREYLNPEAKFYGIDIRADRVSQIFEEGNFDFVFHLAAQIDVRKSVTDPKLDNDVNVNGGINILENCRVHRVKKVVFASTGGAVYGDAEVMPTPEDYPVYPVSPYGIHKLAFEKYLNYYKKVYDQDYTALRFANVYGPRQYKGGEAGVVAIFVDHAINDKKLLINGDGLQTRDYVYVGDVVRALVLSMGCAECGEVNIGTGVETTVVKIVEMIEKSIGRSVDKENLPAKAGEQRRSCLDISRAEERLGWRPEVGLEEGISRTVEWSRKQIKKEN